MGNGAVRAGVRGMEQDWVWSRPWGLCKYWRPPGPRVRPNCALLALVPGHVKQRLYFG